MAEVDFGARTASIRAPTYNGSLNRRTGICIVGAWRSKHLEAGEGASRFLSKCSRTGTGLCQFLLIPLAPVFGLFRRAIGLGVALRERSGQQHHANAIPMVAKTCFAAERHIPSCRARAAGGGSNMMAQVIGVSLASDHGDSRRFQSGTGLCSVQQSVLEPKTVFSYLFLTLTTNPSRSLNVCGNGTV
jgi:hypothetical protein